MQNASKAGVTTFTTPSDREIVMTRDFDAPRRLVFEAWTNPEHLPHWMLGPEGWTMPVCEIDLRPGGAWHFVWRHVRRHRDGDARRLSRGRPARAARHDRVVGRRLARNAQYLDPHRGGRQDDDREPILYPTKEARDAALKTGMKDGVSASFDRLAEYVQTMA